MNHVVRGAVLAAALAAAACGSETSSTPAAPPAQPPPSPPLTISFAEEAIRAREGDTIEIGLRWEIRELANPLQLEVSPLGMTAEADDYVFPANTVTIPAGSATTGAATLSLTAVSDRQIGEGDETLALRLAPPAGVAAELGRNLEITISEAGGSPCPGVRISAIPIARLPAGSNRDDSERLGTTLDMHLGESARSVRLDWTGPYLDPAAPCESQDDDYPCSLLFWPSLRVSPTAWRVESAADGVRHSLGLEWPETEHTGLRFRSGPDGGCVGAPEIRCDAGGCDLLP